MKIQLWKLLFTVLWLTLALFFIAAISTPDSNLHIIACDVGQGDAILITYKNMQILTDGGPDSKVLNCLGKHLPFWDREIELVVLSHPDADHITGIIEVIKRFKVDNLIINDQDPGTEIYRVLRNMVGSQGIKVVKPKKGMALRSGMIYLDIVNLSESSNLGQTTVSGSKTNQNSVAYLLTYAQFKAFLPGDIPREISDELAQNWSLGSVNYIKIPHHGSSNGLTQNLLEKLMPKVAIISVAKNNRWGFPSPEIIKMLESRNVKILRTDETGDVEVVSNGSSFWLR